MFGRLSVCILVLLFCLTLVVSSTAATDDLVNNHYDESIFVISNFSGVDASHKETRSIQELLNQDIGGFRFYLEWEHQRDQLMLRGPQGNSTPFIDQLNLIKDFLYNHPDRVLTLFLDFNVNIRELTTPVRKSGIDSLLYVYDTQTGWPTLKEMIDTDKRLIIFGMQEHRNSPKWLHYVWNHAVEPYYSILEAPVFIGEFLKGDPKNSLLIFNDYNLPRKPNLPDDAYFNSVQNPYLIEHIKKVWANTGKTPNFVMLDRYENWIKRVIAHLQSFHTIQGTVTFNTQTLNYVSWERTNSLTSGKFCFPAGPGDTITLAPKSPGFRFTPESVTFIEPDKNKSQHFVASPLEITAQLEAFYNFEDEAHDLSINNFTGKATNVTYRNDPDRSTIAHFDEKSYVILPKADELKLLDHDFTVAAWVKIDEYKRNKYDYCILGTPGGSYQQCIHLIIRNKQPYFGFFSNDLQGKTQIEAGKWYHLVWRYNRQNGEQAIYVNGKPDSRSLGHPSYKGRDHIYIGLGGYNDRSNMIGSMDDLAIWSRMLGEEEIWKLSKDLAELTPRKNIFIRYPIFSRITIILMVIIILIWTYQILPFRHFRKNHLTAKKLEIIEQEDDYPEKNYIQLFGDFKVIDKEGSDITNQFTPKIKQLFLLILIYSQRSKKGITTKELSEFLWPDLSYPNAKNSRGVTIRKLRLILQSLDEVEVIFNSDCWTIRFSKNIYCDYTACLKLLNETQDDHHIDFYLNFYKIVRAGEIFKGESHEWLDDFKGNIGNHIVDVLMKFIDLLNIENDHELILKLSDRILVTDPVNDQALSFKLRALVKQNKLNTARFTYEKFAALYEELYNEHLALSFEDFLKC